MNANARALFLGVFLAMSTVPAFGAETVHPASGAANPAWRLPVTVGPATGIPEYDSIGFVTGTACTPAPRYSAEPRLVGATTGNPEWDSYGLVLEGETPCAASETTR